MFISIFKFNYDVDLDAYTYTGCFTGLDRFLNLVPLFPSSKYLLYLNPEGINGRNSAIKCGEDSYMEILILKFKDRTKPL